MRASAINSMPKPARIDSKLVPPADARSVGFFRDRDGEDRIIYEEMIVDVAATKASKKIRTRTIAVVDASGRPVIDEETGEQKMMVEEVWKRHETTGERLYPIWDVVPVFRKRRFILRANGRGNVAIVENFEPTAHELRMEQVSTARAAFLEDLVTEASQRGISASQLIDSILGKVQPEEAGGEFQLSDAERERLDGALLDGADEARNAVLAEDEAKPRKGRR